MDKVYPGEDKITRVMLVKTVTLNFKRSVGKVCVLHIEM